MYYLILDPYQPISHLQDQFNHLFPFLRLEIFAVPHKPGEGSPWKMSVSGATRLRDYMSPQKKGTMPINPDMTVSQVEQEFKRNFHLNIQVLRKSGSAWLETTGTDSWTLRQQNEEGATSQEEIK